MISLQFSLLTMISYLTLPVVVLCSVLLCRTGGPWQGEEEALYEILETPGYDGVVVQSHIESNCSTSQAKASQVRTYLEMKII